MAERQPFLWQRATNRSDPLQRYLDGDLEVASKVELESPETGVCGISSAPNANDCCMPVSSAKTSRN